MLKKYMIFGSVVLLLAALLTMTGCSQATDSDGGSTAAHSANYLYGNANQDDVDIAVKAARLGNRSVVLGENLRLTGTGPLTAVADFEDMPVRVEKDVTVNNMIINAAYANFTFDPGASITLGANAVFIYSGIPDEKNIILAPGVAGNAKVKLVDKPLLGTQGTDTGIAVADYHLGPNFNDIHRDVIDLYVLKTLKIDAQSVAVPAGTAGDPRVIALGEVDLAASYSPPVGADIVFTSSATLTSKVPGVILNFPDDTALTLPTIEATVPINIAGHTSDDIGNLRIVDIKGPSTLTISPANGQNMGTLRIDNVSESGKVVVSTANLGATTIPANAGSISLTATGTMATVTIGDPVTETGGNARTGTIALSVTAITAAVTVVDNEGVIEFDTPLISGGGIDIARNAKTGEIIFKRSLTNISFNQGLKVPNNEGNILFQGGLTAGVQLGDPEVDDRLDNIAGSGTIEVTGLATFNGANTNIDCNMVFNGGLTVGANPVFLGGDVTLANTREITLPTGAITLKGGKRLLVGAVPVLAGGAAGAVINSTAATLDTLTPDPDEPVTYKTLVLNAPITVTSGELRILGTGLLSFDNTGAINVAPAGALTLADGGILELPTGRTVTIGDTTITGVTTSGIHAELIASGGDVVLKQNSISGTGSTLLVSIDYPGPAFAVTGANNLLYLAGANLDLQNGGSLTIGNDASVVLESGTYPGKITLGNILGSENIPYTGSLHLKHISSTNQATISGNGTLLGDEADELPSLIGQLSGTQKQTLTITGSGGGSLINAGRSVVD
jgi:hypothetical protein